MSRIWTPSAALKASAALHVGAALGTAALPVFWPFTLAAIAANHALLTVAGLLPRSRLLGPNITHLSAAAIQRREIALTIDDGPDPEVTPRVLDLLDESGVQASFFCIGHRARAHPALCKEISARGHRVENHGYSHSNAFSLFSPARMRADIAAAQSTLSDITGQAPLFFRPTAGLRNPFLEPVLASLDLHLASWTRRPYDTRDGRTVQVLQRLTRGLRPGDILLMHDGHAALTEQGQAVILATLPQLLDTFKHLKLSPVTLQQAQS